MRYIIRHKASFHSKKRQRKSGGSKNVYIIGFSSTIIEPIREQVESVFKSLGAEPSAVYHYNEFIFTKRPDAEKAWAWVTLRIS